MKQILLTTIAAVVLVGCGESSIHDAANGGNIEAVKQHIAAGADVNANAKGEEGLTPLQYATFHGHKEVAELLIAKGADVDARQYGNGLTSLHYAALNGRKVIVELLIAKGANENAKADNGATPLDMASGKAADLLRKHGGKTSEELKAAAD